MTQWKNIDTPRVSVTTDYHGVSVTEEYRWLEDAGSEQVRAWTAAQGARTRAFIDGLPGPGALRQRVEEVVKAGPVAWGGWNSGPRRGGPHYFILKRQPPKQQPFLVVLGDLRDITTAAVLVDPNMLDETGATTIDWFVPSPDGRFVAVSLSSHGTEQGTLHVIEVSTAAPVGVQIPRVNSGTMGGSLAWAADATSFWYTRGQAPGDRPEEDLAFFQEVWHHTIGHALTRDRPDQPPGISDAKIAEHNLTASANGRWLMDAVQKGDGGEWQIFVRAQREGDWWRVADISDKCVDAVFGGDWLYLLSHAGARRGQVLKLELSDRSTVAQAHVIVPESGVVLEGLAATEKRLWLLDIDGGPSGLRVCGTDGAGLSRVEVPAVSAIEGLVALGPDQVAYAVASYTRPRVWWTAAGASPPEPTALVGQSPSDLSGYEVRRELATSADGTRVPMTVLSRPGVPRNGTAPAILTGYGGYGISLKPSFDPTWLPWLEQGGVVAEANLRGGGEYGQEWHQGGQLTAKQNVFNDFVACAQHLFAAGITSPRRLAILGGSNGGLLMGAVLTQHPEIARAVVAMVPVMDMLRVELHPNGAFNVTEFGTVQDQEQFEALYSYSPYHNVHDGVAYPATLLTTGELDPRVDPYHAKKMTARLQAATGGDEPVLLRVKSGGHGVGEPLDEVVNELTDIYAFIFDRLGVEYQPRPARDHPAGPV